MFQSVQTVGFVLLNRAALLVRPQGAARLRLMGNAETKKTVIRIKKALARADSLLTNRG